MNPTTAPAPHRTPNLESIRVYSIGPALTVRGGVSQLIAKLDGAFPPHIQHTLIPTCSQYMGDSNLSLSTKIGQLALFLWSVLRVLVVAIPRSSRVFHVHLSQLGSTLREGALCVILRLFRCHYIVHSHGCHKGLFHAWVPRVCRRALLWGICGAEYTVTLTHFWHKYYSDALKLPASKLLVLPNPAYLPPSLPDRRNRDAVRFLFLGRVGEHKGAFDAIKAFAGIPEDVRSHCYLTLAGDGDITCARTMIETLGCSERVYTTGWVSSSEVERLLLGSDVLLLPSHGEGMSMALLEAMAWGLAIVTTPECGTPEFLQSHRNCILVTAGDVSGLSRAIEELARTPELRHCLGAEARTTASIFSLSQYVATLTSLYERIVEGRSELIAGAKSIRNT